MPALLVLLALLGAAVAWVCFDVVFFFLRRLTPAGRGAVRLLAMVKVEHVQRRMWQRRATRSLQDRVVRQCLALPRAHDAGCAVQRRVYQTPQAVLV